MLNLIGTRSNRSAIGARVTLKTGAQLQFQEVTSQSSYYSHNDHRLHFGLGENKKADSIEILWPSGAREVLNDVPANKIVNIREGSGFVR
jgi:enediyne biosynthesis protein E4